MQTLSFWRLLYPREAFLKKLLGFHYKNKLYLEVLPGAKLSNMYCPRSRQEGALSLGSWEAAICRCQRVTPAGLGWEGQGCLCSQHQAGTPAPATAAPSPPARPSSVSLSVGAWGTTMPQILNLGPWSPKQTERHLK